MSVVTLILPKDRSILEKKYSQILAEIVAETLTPEEIEYLITEYERKNDNVR
ncbi:MAG: hypothetical protein AB6733_10660 [Clostridiaceae bacterium]